MASNLQFIKSATTTASTLNVTNCFSDVYDFYKIFVSDYESSGQTSTNYNIRLLDSSGNTISASEYDYATHITNSNASAGEYRGTNNSFLRYFPATHSTQKVGIGATIYVFNPYNSSSYTFLNWQGTGWSGTVMYGYKALGVHKSAEQITGFQVYAHSGTMIDFEVSVYGVK